MMRGSKKHKHERYTARVFAYVVNLALVLFALGVISGCSSGNDLKGRGETVSVPSNTVAKPTIVTTPLSTLTTTGYAPPYAEIKRKIDSIMKRDQYPEGPPRNFEGLADPQMAADFQQYLDYLRRKLIQNWQGWVIGVSESEIDQPNTNFNVSLRMEQPLNGSEPLGGVLLEDVPREQVLSLGFTASTTQLTPHASGQYRLIIFDGVIVGAFDTAEILVSPATIRNP